MTILASTWRRAVTAIEEVIMPATHRDRDEDRADDECLDEAEPTLVYDNSDDGKVEAG